MSAYFLVFGANAQQSDGEVAPLWEIGFTADRQCCVFLPRDNDGVMTTFTREQFVEMGNAFLKCAEECRPARLDA